MIHELRVYHCIPGRLPALLNRFETITLKIWERHGIKQGGFWTVLVGDSNQDLYSLLEWESLADREKKSNEARAYANNTIPKARGAARKVVLEARSYRERRVAEAIGTTDAFLALLEEYEKAPDITRTRLSLEAMEKILPKVKKYIIDSEHGRVPFNLRVTRP